MRSFCLKGFLCMSLFSIFLSTSCSTSSNVAGSGDLVTVEGVVFSIDDFSKAVGVIVYLLDNKNNYKTSTATDSTGAFSLQVPAGSRFLLVTDDFDEANDNWYPLINYEELHTATIDNALSGIGIHACPQPAISTTGTIAALNNYLANATQNAGIFSQGAVSEANEGIVALATFFLEGTGLGSQAGLGMTIDKSGWPVGYGDANGALNADFAIDSTVGPNFFQASTATATDESGLIYSFGDPSQFSGNEIQITFTHSTLSINSPVDVPVRNNHITLILPVSVDGVANKTTTDLLTFFGLL